MQLNITHNLLPKTPTTRTSMVMDHFGIDFETGRHVIAEGLELPIAPGDLVLFTGPSGAGKSSLLRAVAQSSRHAPRDEALLIGGRRLGGAFDTNPEAPHHAERDGYHDVIDIDTLELGERTLIDAIGLPVEEALRLLCACGLGEARLLLRTPGELSDGQRYRFRLALAVAQSSSLSPEGERDRFLALARNQGEGARADGAPGSPVDSSQPAPRSTREGLPGEPRARPLTLISSLRSKAVPLPGGEGRNGAPFLLADEFTATLDRTLAKVVAFNVRRLADRTGLGFLLATTHEDVAGDLAPDVHVRCRLDGKITVTQASPGRLASPGRQSGDASSACRDDKPHLQDGTRRQGEDIANCKLQI